MWTGALKLANFSFYEYVPRRIREWANSIMNEC